MLHALKLKIPINDKDFDSVYPQAIRDLSARHFTPFHVSRQVTEWLNELDAPKKVLDLGCGVGKFCFVAAALTKHEITGIDIRENYIDICRRLNKRFGFENLQFIHQNIIEHDLKNYNVFYFFNSFLEYIDHTARMDNKIENSGMLFSIYETYLRQQLFLMPEGTVVITYHALSNQIPLGYDVIKRECNDDLLMWIKK